MTRAQPRRGRPVHYAVKPAGYVDPAAFITVCGLVVSRRGWVVHDKTLTTCRNCSRKIKVDAGVKDP